MNIDFVMVMTLDPTVGLWKYTIGYVFRVESNGIYKDPKIIRSWKGRDKLDLT